MKGMLFEMVLSGHRMEYIHHIYMGMLEHQDDEFVIVVPTIFEDRKKHYQWPESRNIRIVYIDDSLLKKEKNGLIRQSFYQVILLRKYVKQEKVNSVFLISLLGYIVALPFLISRKVRVSGILYSIYLYTWRQSSLKRRLQDVSKFIIMRITPCLRNVYVLNDETSAARLNKLYLTDKFKYLTDPYNTIDYEPKNIRAEIGAYKNDKVFLHFGGLDRRKGTLDILEAIPLLSLEQQRKCVFVFAGMVYDSIYTEFYQLIKSLPSCVRVRVYNFFCSNEFIADLCFSSDFILAPYYDTNRSSGLLGYAAHFGTPVIGPEDGLIGYLIKKYKLGITLSQKTSMGLAVAITDAVPYRMESVYKDMIQVDSFVNTLFSR